MKVLVTGGEGYIGSNLKVFFEGEGWRFISYDIKNNLDIREKDTLEHFIREADAVIHLAAISGVESCRKNPLTASTTTLDGTYNVIQLCKKYGIPVWFASSFAAAKPTSMYGMLKRAGELLCKSSRKAYILRISNVYGGKRYLELKNSVIAKWTKALIKGEPITIHGTGNQTRDFIHIKDVCTGIIMQIKKWLKNQNPPKTAYLCTGKQTSINHLANIFRKYAPKPIRIVHTNPRPDDPLNPPSFKPSYPPDYKFISVEEGIKTLLRENLKRNHCLW